ncbi:hypothetical protein BC833DRAFT_574966 [Globomyces pollinis-pini]|nr:hypothetical protein BC833DRAFT_574966 [Globomyces pollinis-pini]KAJ2999652.1 hypothetical protein HDV02_002125 [Globomyces sp. JEL0801]
MSVVPEEHTKINSTDALLAEDNILTDSVEGSPKLPSKQKEKRLSKKKINWIKSVAGIHSKPYPLFPDNGLSINERFFHANASNSPQVVLLVAIKVALHKDTKHLSENRLLDLVKWTSSEMFRTACTVDYASQTLVPMGETAADLRIKSSFTTFVDDKTPLQVAQKAINYRFNMKDPTYPCWKVDIVAPNEIRGDGITLSENSVEKLPTFHILFSFHHCLGDGLSVFSFTRLFFSKLTSDAFNAESLNLQNIPITKAPPPILDNYIYSNFFGVVPAALEMIGQQLKKQQQKSLQLKRLAPVIEEDSSLAQDIPSFDLLSFPSDSETLELQSPISSSSSLASPLDSERSSTNNDSASDSPEDIRLVHQLPNITQDQEPIVKSGVRWVSFDENFSKDMLKNTRFHKTTISAVVIVAAISAVRQVFLPRAEKMNEPMPGYQSWVCTTSMRHLIPDSKLLEGADKETDPSIMEFGGYGGSISDEKFKFNAKSELWNRAKSVRKQITGQFLRSMRRMKLLNYTYRKPTLWKTMEKTVDLKEYTRSYSVEVANLGSWKSANLNPETPNLADIEWFCGCQNNSYVGARALFSIAVISIADVLSFAVSYDMDTITEKEADLFLTHFKYVLELMRETTDQLFVSDL